MKLLLGAARLAIGLFGITFLFWLGIAYEGRPAGLLSFQLVKFGPACICHTDPGGWRAQLQALKAQERAAAARAQVVDTKQRSDTHAVGAHEVATVTHTQVVTRTLTKEIPLVIPPAVDRSFPLSVGFVRLHDAAARGVDLSDIAASAGAADGSPSSVTPSDAAAVIVANYGACHADDAELAAWQEFYSRLRADQAPGGAK